MAKFVNKQQVLGSTAFNQATIFSTAASRIGSAFTALETNKGHVIIGCNVANTHSATVTVDIALVTDGGTNDDTIRYIAKNVSIPVGGSVELITGKIVIGSDSEEIHGRCSVNTGAEVILSVLENA